MRAVLLVLLLLITPAAAHVRHHAASIPLPRPSPCQCATQVESEADLYKRMSVDLAALSLGPPIASFTPTSQKVTFSNPTPPQTKTKGHHMFEWFWKLVEANLFAAFLLGAFGLYMIVRHGYPWVAAKVTSIWNSSKADLDWVEGRVTTLEGAVGVTTPPKPAPAPPVVKPAPVVKAPKVPAAPVVAAAPMTVPDVAAMVKAAVAAEMAKVAPVAVAVAPAAPAV